jgi:hypothetical protein
VVVLGLAVVVLAAGWRLSGSSHPARAGVAGRPAPMTLTQRGLPEALRQQLQQLLRQGVDRVPGRPLPIPPVPRLAHPGICAVAAGSCSLTPCVEFAGGATATVLRLATPARRGGPPPRACDGRLGAPKVLPVAAR